MNMQTKFILIGYGWRADFFYRIARMLPERFRIAAWVLRTGERAAQVQAETGVYATADLEEALGKEHDFVVLCIPRNGVKSYLTELMEKKEYILCETPPGKDKEELNELWETKQRLEGKVQIVEQYPLQPYYASVEDVINRGTVGDVMQVMLSALHGYHAVSIFRRFLKTGFENCVISGKVFPYNIVYTNGREGFDCSGKLIQSEREWAAFRFDSGKAAFMDFSGEQYFSMIRSRRWNIQGTRGEINDMTVRFLSDENIPVVQEIRRFDAGVNNNSEWSHKRMTFMDRAVYENPFYPARMNDDEIAVASCLHRMKEYTETGKDFYPLREALQDTYLSFLLEEAEKCGRDIQSESQLWADKK